jgi:hypothetical protein
MSQWAFWEYVEASGRAPFSDWLEAQPVEAQARIDARILQMAGMVRWPEKWVSAYHGAGKLYELRVPFNRVQYRPLGMYSDGHSFVLLAGAIEKGGKIPASVVAAAANRRDIVQGDMTRVRRYRIH